MNGTQSGFIKGLLEENKAGATLEGVVYDRWLKLRHPSGKLLKIFDMDMISAGLPIGKTYEMILQVVAPGSPRYFSTPPATIDTTLWHGTVIDTHWLLPRREYLRVIPQSDRVERVLLATPLGQVLTSQHDFGDNLSAGGHVQWEDGRLDLLAIL